jgi:hypothetical protein
MIQDTVEQLMANYLAKKKLFQYFDCEGQCHVKKTGNVGVNVILKRVPITIVAVQKQ